MSLEEKMYFVLQMGYLYRLYLFKILIFYFEMGLDFYIFSYLRKNQMEGKMEEKTI